MEYKDMMAIDIVRLMLTDGVITQEQAAKYFPGLTESKNEKIRKAILDLAHDGIAAQEILENHGFTVVDVENWLEKQGEQKPIDFSNLHTWKYIVDAVLTEREGIGQYIDSPWTKDMAEKLQERFGTIEQKPAEWSEEDEEIRMYLFKFVELNKEVNLSPEDADRLLAWLEKQAKPVSESLRCNEDEKIRTDIVAYIKRQGQYIDKYKWHQWLAWLEKQGEQKPTTIQPKFEQGDWVINTITKKVEQVIKITNGEYICSGHLVVSFNNQHLLEKWTIQDAKDGDVLIDFCEDLEQPLIFILKKFESVDFGLVKKSDYSSYCFLTANNKQTFKVGDYHHIHNIRPATKEQRDLLFSKMKEAGYEWDADKKELKKIEQNHAEWSEHQHKLLNYAISMTDDTEVKAFLESLRNTTNNKHEWSEDDEHKIDNCCLLIGAADGCYEKEFKDSCIHFLQSLKSLKPQKQYINIYSIGDMITDGTSTFTIKNIIDEYYIAEDGDKVCFDVAHEYYRRVVNGGITEPQKQWKESLNTVDLENSLCELQDGFHDGSHEYKVLADAIEFIRSTETQKQWKPTKEQIKAIRLARAFVTDDFNDNPTLSEILIQLEEQLKKL